MSFYKNVGNDKSVIIRKMTVVCIEGIIKRYCESIQSYIPDDSFDIKVEYITSELPCC